MLDVLIGIGCGMAVCAFGMWCFIHGQHNAVDLLHGQKPVQMRGPVEAVAGAAAAVQEKREAAATQDELEELLSYDGRLPDERRDEA